MRTLKFRVMKDDHSKWIYFDLLDSPVIVAEIDRETLGQFTGLKSKSGVEIYEGDVVRIKYQDRSDICEVIFFHGAWQTKYIKSIGKRMQNKSVERLYSYAQQSEVIGNVMENPELLKDS